MNRETRERIRQAVAEIAAPYQHRNHRRQLAAFLRELAEEYQPRRRAGRGLPPGADVRRNGDELFLGRALWYAAGSHRRVHIDIDGTMIRIVANDEGEHKVYAKPGQSIQLRCHHAWQVGQWDEGWRPGRVEGNAILFDIEAERP